MAGAGILLPRREGKTPRTPENQRRGLQPSWARANVAKGSAFRQVRGYRAPFPFSLPSSNLGVASAGTPKDAAQRSRSENWPGGEREGRAEQYNSLASPKGDLQGITNKTTRLYMRQL